MVTPVQGSRRQSPLDRNGDVLSHLNPKSLRGSLDPELPNPDTSGTIEKQHASDAMMVSGIKRAPDPDSKSFSFISSKALGVNDYHQSAFAKATKN